MIIALEILLAILLFAPQPAAGQSTASKAAPEEGAWKGDLTGVWQGPYTPDLTRGTQAVLTPWGQQQFDLFDGKMDPCLPVGVTRQANAPDPIEIVQTPTRVVVLYESWHIFRSIPTDGRDHPKSDQLHLIERLRRTGPKTMSYEVTVDDPKAYTAPWRQSRVFQLQPKLELME